MEAPLVLYLSLKHECGWRILSPVLQDFSPTTESGLDCFLSRTSAAGKKALILGFSSHVDLRVSLAQIKMLIDSLMASLRRGVCFVQTHF